MATIDIHKDPITARLERGAHWLADRWQQVLTALAAVAVAAALTVFVVHNLRKLSALAWEQLSSAHGFAARGDRAQALQAVNQLLTSTRSGPLVAQAHLFKGDLLMADQKKDEALAAYQEAARQAPTPDLKALADAGIAACHEQSSRWAEAEEAYKRFIQEHPEHFLTGRMYEGQGRMQIIQQKWTEAQATLERLITLYPTSAWAKTAQEYLAVVKANLGAPKAP
jgi:tetratricopeptide (TPR) repeat protein